MKGYSKYEASKFKRIISAATPLAALIARGYTSEQIKSEVIEALGPYFENKRMIEESALFVIPECVSLYRIQRDAWCLGMFEKCLSTFRAAKANDPEGSIKSLAMWQTQINTGLSKFWSILHLEVDKSDLETEELIHECLRNIGDIIEGVMKPYLKCLLHQTLIAKGIKPEANEIDKLELGEIVNQLIRSTNCNDLLAPPPGGIRINKWRNVAYHHSARIEGRLIICKLGTEPRAPEIALSRNDLLAVTRRVVKVYEIIRLSHTVFILDNLTEVKSLAPVLDTRIEARFVNLATALASQGFVIKQFSADAEEAILVVQDSLNPGSPQNIPIRGFHASQFLFPLWSLTASKLLIVEYHEANGTRCLRASCSSQICGKIDRGETGFETLAATIEIIDLRTNKSIPPLIDLPS